MIGLNHRTPFPTLLSWQAFDILSDILNGAFKIMEMYLDMPFVSDETSIPKWIVYLFILLGAISLPLGIYQVVERGRVKTSYRQIIRGDNPEVATALDDAGGSLSSESIAIRRSLIVLDMTVCDVGIRGFLIEDLPSILLNAAVILIQMRAGSEAGASTLASFVSLLFSCLMTGRKSGLRQVRRDLRQKKLDLEQLERMKGTQMRLQIVNEDMAEELRLKKHTEEDLKVRARVFLVRIWFPLLTRFC